MENQGAVADALTHHIESATMTTGLMSKYRVLVLCTGNSARSQMAEGLINAQLADRFEAQSAGTQPSGFVHPVAKVVMREIGIDMERHRSKSANEFIDQVFDLVITVCDDAAENCPVWLGRGEKVHIGFPDPAAAPINQQPQQFRAVRDAIQNQLLGFLKTWQPASPGRNHGN
jgi:arsenate reductase